LDCLIQIDVEILFDGHIVCCGISYEENCMGLKRAPLVSKRMIST